MVGRGVFKQSRDGRVRSYRVAGRSETVRVTWDRGDGPRTTIIATDRAEALAGSLRQVDAKVRVDPGGEDVSLEDVSLEEVDRLPLTPRRAR